MSEVWKEKKVKEVATIENVDEVEKNDDLMKKLSINNLSCDERNFAFQDLTNLILFVMPLENVNWLLLIDLLKSFWLRILPMKKRKNLQLKSLNIKFLF